MIFPHTVTVYNFTKAGYNRTVLTGVLWIDTKGKNVNKTGSTAVDSLKVIIPFTVDSSGSVYKLPADYQLFPTAAWTMQTKQKDFIIKGECPYAYSTAHPISELVSGYDALTITDVKTCDYGNIELHHWEVGAK